MLTSNQPGTVLQFQAKPGMGDRLFELTNALHFTGDPDGPTDWVLCRADDDPDTLWAFEFYADDASFERHFADPVIDANHEEVIDLLAAPPMRVTVRPAFSGFAS
ncbi:antibiotic biosynthesis monooxygenase [Curtobacterium sp. MCPF17_047]|uniref:putative quinol monooxygenase n=1 Tax=unclassified Curtobacterium TaxID=257496 RepID=UPI000DA98748|nr:MULTISPECIES: antibiotic biosynthesis monooxygenase [unclassified Curtobacterium]PZE57311.1 antibiotic biosynthesis monooxygenase [Curtobacterium sp. MCPF17_001]PZF63595.1 antibiotic biosynthesis monooxygenase [Curtobacterium sp. MCPF17_047]